jgi:TRAP-type transport system periplasmic protein
MIRILAGIAALAVAFLPSVAMAEPITLKLAFFSSDQSVLYRAAVTPFVDAVNADGKGVVQIIVYSGGVLGHEVARQPQVALDGTADIAYIVPGYTSDAFPDDPVVELPGLFHDAREASLVYSRLIALNALRGYDDFVVLGAYVTEPETIHSRLPVASIDDLKGRRVRVNNKMEAAALEKLGAMPVSLELSQVADAISAGDVDAAVLSVTPMSDFGVDRVATHHYFLGFSGALIALVMNRKVFDALPQKAQDILKKYAGDWSAEQFVRIFGSSNAQLLQKLKTDPRRVSTSPSPADLARAQSAFDAVAADWLASDPRNQQLLTAAQDELSKVRAAN